MNKKSWIGWIEKRYAKEPFYWKDPNFTLRSEGIFKYKAKASESIKEVKIKITVEEVK